MEETIYTVEPIYGRVYTHIREYGDPTFISTVRLNYLELYCILELSR